MHFVGYCRRLALFSGLSHNKVNIAVDMLAKKIFSVNIVLDFVESFVKHESVELTFAVCHSTRTICFAKEFDRGIL